MADNILSRSANLQAELVYRLIDEVIAEVPPGGHPVVVVLGTAKRRLLRLFPDAAKEET